MMSSRRPVIVQPGGAKPRGSGLGCGFVGLVLGVVIVLILLVLSGLAAPKPLVRTVSGVSPVTLTLSQGYLTMVAQQQLAASKVSARNVNMVVESGDRLRLNAQTNILAASGVPIDVDLVLSVQNGQMHIVASSGGIGGLQVSGGADALLRHLGIIPALERSINAQLTRTGLRLASVHTITSPQPSVAFGLTP